MTDIQVIQRELTRVREEIEHTMTEDQLRLIDELEMLVYQEQRELDLMSNYRLAKEGE